MINELTEVKVKSLPPCDICASIPGAQVELAAYDAKTSTGPWAYLCPNHFKTHAATQQLGTGRGQRLFVEEGE